MTAGFRYNKICLRLDQGALSLLPQISDNVLLDTFYISNKYAKYIDWRTNTCSEPQISKWQWSIWKAKASWSCQINCVKPKSRRAYTWGKAQFTYRRVLAHPYLWHQLKADDLSKRILNIALDPFRWNFSLSVLTSSTSTTDNRTLEAKAKMKTPNCNPTSIEALSDAAEHIAGCAQSQKLHPIRDSSSIAMGTGLRASHRKCRRAESIPSFDLCEARAQTTSQRTSGMEIAMVTEVDKLARTLGEFLFAGMEESLMRCAEIDRGWYRSPICTLPIRKVSTSN